MGQYELLAFWCAEVCGFGLNVFIPSGRSSEWMIWKFDTVSLLIGLLSLPVFTVVLEGRDC